MLIAGLTIGMIYFLSTIDRYFMLKIKFHVIVNAIELK